MPNLPKNMPLRGTNTNQDRKWQQGNKELSKRLKKLKHGYPIKNRGANIGFYLLH